MAAHAPQRMDWLDRAKGAGILLVVFGHAWLGTANAGLLRDPTLVRVVETLVYSFHMPLFFLLSGWTFEGWATRRTLGTALLDRAKRLIWPMVLWTYVFISFRIAAGAAANTTVGLDALLTWPLPPQDHLWFLWALLLIQLITLAILRLVPRPLPDTAWLGMAIAGAAIVSVPGMPFGVLTANAAFHIGIFWLGIWLARRGDLPTTKGAGIVALAAFLFVSAWNLYLPEHVATSIGVAALLATAFCVIMRNTDGWPGIPVLDRLGQYSMGIYLSHTIFTAATRTVLMRLTDNATLHLVLGTLAGVIGPLLLYALLRRLGAVRLAGF